ncbi:MAG TPA: DNA recombination protein RmuC [Cyclobacteriaceae bacterium]|nr:DNA recombination protein RmuC [Cyclobacteriaceae bacterium]HNP06845.1 DNA recombination protein RmuC [Cyclobacteriaceae bacterium]HRK54545.1 DNA recombination protein RmuC [Cyclobacteriaceae bacterium]
MEIVILLAGIVIGAIAGWLIAKYKYSADGGSLAIEQEKTRALTSQTLELKKELEHLRHTNLELNTSLSATEANYRNLQEKLADQKKELETLQEKFSVQFENLANRIFEEKSKKFTEQNKTNMTDVLKPLGEKIIEFEKRIDLSHKDSIEKNASLFNELKNLKELNLQMGEDARNLTRALKSDTKTQGSWGELILETILEKSGLEKGREYTVQETFYTEDGRRQRPDVIINLPESRHIIIDSKVSLTAYNNYVNAEKDDERDAQVKLHMQSIKQHMRILTDKNYQKNYSDNGLDFVIMFIPIETAYLLAIQTDPKLYEEAFDKRIVFVSPTLLLPSLQLIKSVWRQEHQNRNVIEIAKRAGDLYDKFVGFTEDLLTLGRHLNSSKKFYEESMKKLSVGNGNIVSKVENLKKLGAKAEKTIDQQLLGRAEDQGDLFGQS